MARRSCTMRTTGRWSAGGICDTAPVRIFMTGGTGLVGSALAEALVAHGHQVVIVSRAMRSGPDGLEFVGGRTTVPGSWADKLAGCDAVVHLAGEPIAVWRWTDLHRRRVVESRVVGTRELVAALADLPANARPRTLLSASSVDYYPFDLDDNRFAEDAQAGDHLLARMCVEWEGEATRARELDVRTVCLRSGIVIGRGRHSLKVMATPWKLFFRGPTGSGEQWFSWVHIDDVVAAYLFVLERELEGAVNLVAPASIRQGDFARAVASVMTRRVWEHVSEPRLRAQLGDFAEYLLRGRRAVPLRLEEAGFRFIRADAPAALAASLEPDDDRPL
jgi:uncharacterized protein